MPRVVIIGGGISGLSTAYYLRKAGLESTIIEARPRLGGIIETVQAHGCTIELGPDSFLSTKPAAEELANELGLSSEIIPSNEHLKGTHIWRSGRLVRMPDGMTMMVPSRIGPVLRSDLLTWPGKLRAGLDLLRRPSGTARDRSIAEFVTDHFGREVLDYIAEPLLAGVYGGDPSLLGTEALLPKFVDWEAKHGSLIRAARRERNSPSKGPLFRTLRSGLGTLIGKIIAAASPVVIHGNAEKVEKGWRIRVNGDWIQADHLVIACRPSAVLPNLFPEIPYTSARVIALVYRKADLREFHGFGFLVPKTERQRIGALTWVNNKFDSRAPSDKVLIRCFTDGRPADFRMELKEKLGVNVAPEYVHEAEWPLSMPQYEVGHRDKIAITRAMLADFPGLHLAGNSYDGVGIPDCIRSGKQAADRILTSLAV